MKKIIIAETLTNFRDVDINDLYVEAVSGFVFANQYAFDDKIGTWVLLKDLDLPDVVKKSLKKSPVDFSCPHITPEGKKIIKEEKKTPPNNELVDVISKIIKEEVGHLRQEMSEKVDQVEERIGDVIQYLARPSSEASSLKEDQMISKLDYLIDEASLIGDVNRKVSKVLSSAGALETNEAVSGTEDKKKYEALKVKYKNLTVENKLARKNLSKVIAKAKALNAKLEVAEKELEHFKEYSLNASKKMPQEEFIEEETDEITTDIINENLESATENEELENDEGDSKPKITMVSQDILLSNETVEVSNSSEDITGEFDISSEELELASTTRAKSDDDELDGLNLEGLKKGKSYEILNERTWSYDTGAGVVGPLRFDEMIEDLIKGNIKGDTLVKKKSGTSWRPSRECLELNTKAELVYEDPSDIEKNKYLIERTEYRVELQEIISFSMAGKHKEFKGYLTNLSLTGGFIEVTQFEKDYKVGSYGTIYISEGRFERALAIDFSIMRVSHQKRPKGFGIRFEAVSDTVLEVIGECMLDILNNDTDKNKAA